MATTTEIAFTQASTTSEGAHIDEPWVSPANALDSNDTYASVTAGTFDLNDQTEILRVYDASTALTAALPSDLVSIDGVTIRINGYSDSASLVDFDLVQLLDAAGALSGSNLASPSVAMGTDTAAIHTFGSDTEKWGLGAGLTRALLIDPQFGVGIGVLAQTNNSQAFIDYVTIQVAYTPAPVTLYGSSIVPLTLGLTSDGTASPAPDTHYGQSILSLSTSLTSQGQAERLGQSALPLATSLTTSGTRSALGQAALPLALDLTSNGIIEGGAETLYGSAILPLSLSFVAEGRVSVYAHPLTDSVDGTWTTQDGGAELANVIDEHIVSDADYIRSELHPVDSSCRVKLEPLLNPDVDAWHQIDWRIAKDAAAGNTVNMEVRLYQGGGDVLGAGTLIATRTRLDVSETFTTYHEDLTAGEVAAITNYAQLFLEFEGTVA